MIESPLYTLFAQAALSFVCDTQFFQPVHNHQITQISNGNGNKQVINLSHEIDILKKEIEGLKKELAAKNELIDVLRGRG